MPISPAYQCEVRDAISSGVSPEQITGVLMVIARVAGSALVMSAAPKLALAMGYDVDGGLEDAETKRARRDDSKREESMSMPSKQPDARGPVVITGTSTGIGAATAVHLADLGFQVFAGVRQACRCRGARAEDDGSAAAARHRHHRSGLDRRGCPRRRRLGRRAWPRRARQQCRRRLAGPARIPADRTVPGATRGQPGRSSRGHPGVPAAHPARAMAGSSTSARSGDGSSCPSTAPTAPRSSAWRRSATRCASSCASGASMCPWSTRAPPGPPSSARPWLGSTRWRRCSPSAGERRYDAQIAACGGPSRRRRPTSPRPRTWPR